VQLQDNLVTEEAAVAVVQVVPAVVLVLVVKVTMAGLAVQVVIMVAVAAAVPAQMAEAVAQPMVHMLVLAATDQLGLMVLHMPVVVVVADILQVLYIVGLLEEVPVVAVAAQMAVE
jgi:hypothetical protein